jgi:hypothetical protein
MTDRNTYISQIYPKLTDDTRALLDHYPRVRLQSDETFRPLEQHPVIMLVGLTGTGKTTTLNAMRNNKLLAFSTPLPSRRQLTDLIIIPTIQHHLNQPLQPVRDREQRFAYTRAFREQVAEGGAASAFRWLAFQPTDTPVLSEGVRGANEIAHALAHTRWSIIELWIDPLTRLKRLSQRTGAFDTIHHPDAADLSFLPPSEQAPAHAALRAGDISPAAVTTVRAESVNYGMVPYDQNNRTPRYHLLPIADQTPLQVAQAVANAARQCLDAG